MYWCIQNTLTQQWSLLCGIGRSLLSSARVFWRTCLSLRAAQCHCRQFCLSHFSLYISRSSQSSPHADTTATGHSGRSVACKEDPNRGTFCFFRKGAFAAVLTRDLVVDKINHVISKKKTVFASFFHLWLRGIRSHITLACRPSYLFRTALSEITNCKLREYTIELDQSVYKRSDNQRRTAPPKSSHYGVIQNQGALFVGQHRARV